MERYSEREMAEMRKLFSDSASDSSDSSGPLPHPYNRPIGDLLTDEDRRHLLRLAAFRTSSGHRNYNSA